ncbi:TolC family protein [Pedobacter foliorum]|uniref:TolC family protein n=1 Tax=Pedobacter foliorum TaxID=2739058 RepID=UPI00156463D1|nr:TolC family protein [Pedobacter foliorum]NRF38207.1 TolC family protein [Pedobacter foliorum]
MKTLFKTILTALVFLSLNTFAQESMIDDVNYTMLEKYIQSAKENFPRKKVFEGNVERAKSVVSAANISYLDILSASYIYRPDDKTAVNTLNPYNLNGFQFGANINIGQFLQKPAMAKKAKTELKIAQLENEEYESTLTMEVKRRYYNYIRLLNDLKIKTQNVQDNVSAVEDLKNKYEKGTAQLEAYNYARSKAADASSSKIQAEADYLLAKDSLEEIIGKKLTEIK